MFLWALALFTESSIQGDDIPDFGFLTHDKVIHFFIYTIFALVVYRAVRHQERFPLLARHGYLATFFIVALYAATDELHQYFVPNRDCSLYDWFADCLGAVTYLTFDWIASRSRSTAASG
jgi:VanZ family protein